jgi:integrase
LLKLGYATGVGTGVAKMRKINQLTTLKVKSISQPGYHRDGGGLALQVSPKGSKSWIFLYTLQGRSREMGLGSLDTVSLADARSKAKEYRNQLLDGNDPLDLKAKKTEEQRLKQKMTFDACAAAYIKTHQSGWRNAKHTAQWQNTLRTYVSPVFGHLPVSEVDTSLIMRVLSPIWTTKTETASRVRQRIESVLGWATVSGYRSGDNPAKLKQHLDNLLPKIKKAKRHHPSLPWRDIGIFIKELHQQEGLAVKALELAILTACRSGEIRGARWNEIDGDLWTIPADRMKAESMHLVPLSRQAQDLLQKLPRTGEFLFPGAKKNMMSDATMSAVLKRLPTKWKDSDGKDITVHGFRSTFRIWCSETSASRYGKDAAEFALAHKLPDKVEESYQRSTLLDIRRELMQQWADFCDQTALATITDLEAVA